MNPLIEDLPCIKDFIHLKTISKEYTSKVMLGYNKTNQQYYLLKIMPTTYIDNTQKLDNKAYKEVNIWKTLNHPNISKFIDYLEGEDYYKRNGGCQIVNTLVLELGSNASNTFTLFDYLAETGRFKHDMARYYFRQLIEGVEYCHSKGIAHRNIKPEILIIDQKGDLKISDFCFATSINGPKGDGCLYTRLGAPSYMAPELYQNTFYSGQSIDIFACGVVLFIMVYGTPPFMKADIKDPYYNLIYNGKYDIFWKAHNKGKSEDISNESFTSLINTIFEYDPSKRIALNEIKVHPWYQESIPDTSSISEEIENRRSKIKSIHL